MFSSTTLTTKTVTDTGYTLSGLIAGFKVVNIYNSAGALLEQDFYASATIMTRHIPKTDGTVEQQLTSNGKMLQSGTYNAANQMISVKLYATDGKTVKEINDYHYTSKGLIADKIRYTASGTYIEKVTNTYNSNNTINQFVHTDMSGRVTQIDYFNNGRLDHIVKNPPITIDTTKPYVPVIAPVIPGWNGINGYGNIDVIKALKAATGKTLAAIAPSVSVGWGISNAHFDAANAAGYTGKGIVIAAIDTGIDMNNKALTGNLSKYSWNFLTDDRNLQDDNGHGSFVASEMIATDVGNGVVGAAQGAELMVLKALNKNGSGTIANIAKAITYAVDNGANIISMSLGGTITMPSIQAALKYAMSHDVFAAIAAGNSGANSPANPASYAKGLDNIAVVGSSTQSASGASTFSSFSNKTGTNDTPYPFVTAAGAAIKGYNQSGQVVTLSGTSMATPYVASAMAILTQASRETNPNATHATLVQNVMGCMTQNTQALSLVGTLPIPTSLVG